MLFGQGDGLLTVRGLADDVETLFDQHFPQIQPDQGLVLSDHDPNCWTIGGVARQRAGRNAHGHHPVSRQVSWFGWFCRVGGSVWLSQPVRLLALGGWILGGVTIVAG